MLARRLMWIALALLAYAQVGYGALLALLVRRPAPVAPPVPEEALPEVALIVAAHNEAAVIAAKVANARALDYPADRLRVVVAADGCTDETVARARAAGADLVLDLPRGGKVRAQDAAVDATDAPILAFTDANAQWEPDALRALVAALADPDVGYACGQVQFRAADGGTNQEGLYWRYEMAIRSRESALSSVTAGNGAIYAVRREAYVRCDPVMGHDLAMPFAVVKAGRRAIDVPSARASEQMVPTVEGELARKRRMMSHAWPIVLRAGLLDLRGYTPQYAWQIISHRGLRYAGPALHALLAIASVASVRRSRAARAIVAAQAVVALGAAVGGSASALHGAVRRAVLICRYYVVMQAAIALGLLDHLRHGTDAGWEPPEGTREMLNDATVSATTAGAPAAAPSAAAAARRCFDLGVAGTVLTLASPVLAVAALAVRLETPGSPIYRQRRVGRDGVPFDVIKLRTMVDGAEHVGAGLAVDAGDARITRVGALLRRTSIDELPNLVNVLRGEMAIIGPRPTVPSQVEQYTEVQRGRLAIAPGITGWAQVHGRTALPWSERIELDLWYIAHRSWRVDLLVLWRTLGMVFGGDGVYRGERGGWR